MAKDYATESDIIETADPLFHLGDKVKQKQWTRAAESGFSLFVESFSWNTLRKSWTYTLVYFLTGDKGDTRWNGSLGVEEAFEKDLKLISRVHKIKVS
jgi:hypothetical protein